MAGTPSSLTHTIEPAARAQHTSGMPSPIPPKRTYKSYFSDSTRWDRYVPRDDDIVITTPPKVGTTWTQRITSVLVFQDTALPGTLLEASPWLECAFVPFEAIQAGLEQQRHRRFLKSHLPADGMPFHPQVSYLVVGRDLRDAAVSTHNHAFGLNGVLTQPLWVDEDEEAHTPHQPTVPADIHPFWRDYFTRSAFPWESDGWPYNSPTHHLSSWWAHRDRENVLFLHYEDMLADLDREMRRVSDFLGIPVDESIWPGLVKACLFSDMKSQKVGLFGAEMNQMLSKFDFFHEGRNGQWHEVFAPEELTLFRAAEARLPDDLRAWLTRSP
ncbi:sulfotransferase domain-containing protein [Streptomyces daliensis]